MVEKVEASGVLIRHAAPRVVLYGLVVASPYVVGAFAGGEEADNGLVFAAGLNAALVAYVIIAMQFVLTAHYRWVERPLGYAKVIVFHKTMGATAGLLLLSHPFDFSHFSQPSQHSDRFVETAKMLVRARGGPLDSRGERAAQSGCIVAPVHEPSDRLAHVAAFLRVPPGTGAITVPSAGHFRQADPSEGHEKRNGLGAARGARGQEDRVGVREIDP